MALTDLNPGLVPHVRRALRMPAELNAGMVVSVSLSGVPMIRLALLFLLAAPLIAEAQSGTAQVRLSDSAGRPVDGTVTFRGQSGTQTCRTAAGRCQVALQAGSWQASVQSSRGQAATRAIAIRAGRTAVVSIRLGPSRTTATVTPSMRVVRSTATQRVTTAQAQMTRTTRTQTVRTTPQVVRTANVGTTTRTPVRPATTSTRMTTATVVQTTRANTTARTRDLARGGRLACHGSVVDTAGRPVDATITVHRGGSLIGTVRSVAGRFSMYDLAAGRYEVSVRNARSGTTTQQQIVLGSGVARVTIRAR